MPGANRPIRELMQTDVRVVQLESSLPAARKLMREGGIRHLPVVDGDRLVGLLSERELGRLEGFPMVDLNLVSVPDAMASPAYAVAPDTPLLEVVRTMHDRRYGSAVVVDGDEVIGLFTTTDAMAALIRVLG